MPAFAEIWYNIPIFSRNQTGLIMNKRIHPISFLIACVLIATNLVSCSNDSGSADTAITTATQRTGTVGILLTDKPADPSLFVSINASIESVELLGSSDQGRVVLYSGGTKTFDLLRLKNESIPLAFKENVPTGSYCKIRLRLSDLELVLADDTPNDLTDNETYHPKLPGNGKLDLVARDCFAVRPGEIVTLQLDIDGGNSIHIVENKKGFNFRPVVFVDVLSQDFESKLVRLNGKITEINTERNTLLLCDAIPAEQMNNLGCVDIHLGDNAAFFDNVDYSGSPRPIAELLSKDKLGERVTVVGWPRYRVTPYVDVEVPEGHYPPLGECKLWDIDLDAGLQLPPGDCDELSTNVSDTMILVTHEGVEKDRYHPLMVVDALVVEWGEFLQIEGQVATDADSTGFSMTVSSGGPVITSDVLGVMFQPGSKGVNGTRIVSSSGELLKPTQVVKPLPVQVDGTLELMTGSDPLFKAALVILDKGIIGTEQVTGTILSVGAGTITLKPDVDIVCGVATTQLLVNLAQDVEILTVTITEAGSEIVPGGMPAVGQTVGMNGRCEASDYETDNVVIVDDQRT
jgi:hypothetical protein